LVVRLVGGEMAEQFRLAVLEIAAAVGWGHGEKSLSEW
jgi:hypothetical protein